MVTVNNGCIHSRTAGPERGLPRSVYVLQAGLVLNAFGNGAAGPFMVIYLHDVRGVPLGLAGLAVVDGCGVRARRRTCRRLRRRPPRRTSDDGRRTAPRRPAYALYPLLRQPWQAFALAALAGAGIGTWLTMPVEPARRDHAAELRHGRSRSSASLRTSVSASAAWTGGLLVTVAQPETFTRLFL